MKKSFEEETERILDKLSELSPETEEYRKVAESLRILREAQGKIVTPGVDLRFMIGIAAEIGFTLLVLNFERFGVITSKAFRRANFR